MGVADITSREAVLQAIAEFDLIGRNAFLEKYGFGRSKAFWIVYEGNRYDSKAIAGAAYGYEFPDRGPLPNDTFSGGEQGVADTLRALGFSIDVDATPAQIAKRFRKLQTTTLPGGAPSPHKGLLALLALRKLADGGPRLHLVSEIKAELQELLKAALPDVASPSAWEPIWRLENDVWELTDSQGTDPRPSSLSAGEPSVSQLRQVGMTCGLTEDVFTVLSESRDWRIKIEDEIIERCLQGIPSDVVDTLLGRSRPGRQTWWVNQGQTYNQERDGGYIWAPTVNKAGVALTHHTAVELVRPNDVVVHYSGGFVRSLGLVSGDPVIRARPVELPEDSWGSEGHWAPIDYFELAAPIPLKEIGDRPKSAGPFDLNGGVKQGYLYQVPSGWADDLRRRHAPLWPAGSPWAPRGHWLFQANPKFWDLAERLSSWNVGELEDWLVFQHSQDIKPGDDVLLHSSGPDGGILAVGRIVSEPFERDRYDWQAEGPDKVTAVNVALTMKLESPLTRGQLKAHPVLQGMRILRMANATSFKVTDEEWNAVSELINQPDPLDEFLRWGIKFHDDAQFTADEYDYKVLIGNRLREAIEAMRSDKPEWSAQLKRAFGVPNNLTNFRVHTPFVSWAITSRHDAMTVIDQLWDAGQPLDERVQRFVDALPEAVPTGVSSRLSLASVLLMASAPENWPVYRWTPVETTLRLLNRPALPAEPGARYTAFVELLMELVERSKGTASPLRNVLDAQSVMWAVANGVPYRSWDEASRRAFANYISGQAMTVIAGAVQRFRETGGYTREIREKAEDQRQKVQDMLTAEALSGFVEANNDAPFRWISSQAYGHVGGAGPKLSAALEGGHFVDVASAVQELLYGPGSVAERIDALLSQDPPIPGMSEAVATKLIAITRPDDWIPYFSTTGYYGREKALSDLGLAMSDAGTIGERAERSNRDLLAALAPYFGDDTWGMREFIWFLRRERPPQPKALQSLADELHLPVNFLEETIDLLEDKRQVVFFGPPGTGKTFVALKLAEYLTESDAVALVQFHPSYSYEDFVEGYRPTEGGSFLLRSGPLRRIAEAAVADPDRTYVLIIDELNRGNVAKVFGELYFLLEYRDRKIALQYSEAEFGLPKNLLIIATMNSADRSIGLLDGALRRRFYFVSYYPGDDHLKGILQRWLSERSPELLWVAAVVERANGLLNDQHLAIGPSHFLRDDLSDARVRRIWKHSVLPYLADQFFGREHELAKFDLETLRAAVTASAAGATTENSDAAGIATN